MKKIIIAFLLITILSVLCACDNDSSSTETRDTQSEDIVSSKEYKDLQEQLQKAKDAEAKLEAELSKTKAELQEFTTVSDELQQTKGELKIAQDNLAAAQALYENEKSKFAAYKEEMAVYEQLSEKEREAREAEARMTIEKEKAEKEKREKEEKEAQEKARKEAEEKEKKGYNTGITYDQLARTPDKYKGEKVKFTGEIIQILEGNGYNEMRLSVHKSSGGWYDSEQIIYCGYEPSIIDYRLLEGDIITIYGVSQGIISYESVMHTTITLPFVNIDKLEQKK